MRVQRKSLPKVALKSVGCRTNQEEVGSLLSGLVVNGYTIVDKVEDAEVVIVNTCSVTSCSEAKTRRLIGTIASSAPRSRILVTGCYAQQRPEDVHRQTGVHWVVGNTRKRDILTILEHEDGGIFHEPFESARLSVPKIDYSLPPWRANRTRYPLKIQEGCDFRCAYCIVPFVRGPSRSAPFGQIIDECKQSIDAGYKEIVLTGTHIGQYRSDTDESLVTLLERLLRMDGDYRIRLSSFDPRDLSPVLLQLLGEHRGVCDHLHVSFQSLCPDVLKMMNRPYSDFDTMLEMMVTFRKRYPFAGLGSDFIVGFPGETDAMFRRTLEGIHEIGFSYAHVFRYSSRPGTKAVQLSGAVTESVKKERSEQLRSVVDESRKAFITTAATRPHRLLVETTKPVRGITSNYLRVELPGTDGMQRNSWLDIKLKGLVRGRYCIGEVVV